VTCSLRSVLVENAVTGTGIGTVGVLVGEAVGVLVGDKVGLWVGETVIIVGDTVGVLEGGKVGVVQLWQKGPFVFKDNSGTPAAEQFDLRNIDVTMAEEFTLDPQAQRS
jgi:hypothetical protein